MKGVVFLGDRKLELRDFPDPTPGPREVVLEIKASGMCGSDLHNYRAPAMQPGTVAGRRVSTVSSACVPPVDVPMATTGSVA